MRILIVEDDDVLLNGLSVGLRMLGFTPDAVTSLEEAELALETAAFDGMVLDIMLPDGSGLELLGRLRARGSVLPVLLLTARDEVADRIKGLDAGADDYLGKPFDLDELAARLRAILRRGEGRSSAKLAWNGLVLDPARLSGERDGQRLSFSRREFSILQALMERPGVIVAKASLEDRVYGWQEEIESNAVEVHIHKLRAKLGADFIETVRGLGYRLAEARRRR